MGKHDKVIQTSSDEFYENRIADLEDRLKYADETTRRLQREVAKYNKWISEIEAAAQDRLAEKDEYIKRLEETIVSLAVRR